MDSNRREFIKTFVLGIVGTGSVVSILSCDNDSKKAKTSQKNAADEYSQGIELRKGYMVLEPDTQKTLVALGTTMLPGLKDINFREIFMKKMASNYGDAGFYDAGLWNINTASNMQTGKPFYMLETEEEKNKALELVKQTNWSFYNRFRREIITIYYTHPVAWKKLSYNGPPQPNGFLDYDKPPKHT